MHALTFPYIGLWTAGLIGAAVGATVVAVVAVLGMMAIMGLRHALASD